MFRKNTASQFIHFQGVDATTGGIKSGVTWTVRRSIDGTFAAGGGTVTEDGTTGWYKYAMSQADTNGNDIGFNFTGTGAVPQTVNIVTTAADPTDTVRFGLTALPNAAANAAGGLLVSTAGALDMDEMNVDIEAIQASTAGLTFTGAGKVDASVRDWVGDTIPARNITGVPIVDDKYLLGTIYSTPATAGIQDVNVKNMNNVSASAITTIKAVQGLTTADTIATYTGNTPQTGDSYARLGAPAGASVSADIAAVKAETAEIDAVTDQITFTVANQVDANVLDWKSATAPAMTGDAFARLGAPAGATVSADVAAIKAETAEIDAVTDQITFTVANQVDSNVVDWKSATAPAMTGDAFARLGAPAGASVSADIAEIEAETDALLAGVIVTTNNDKTGYSLAAGQLFIKKNTALSNFPFLMTDSTTHAPKTGLTVAATRRIDNGSFASCANAVAEIANGWYTIDFAAADLDGTTIAVRFAATGADDRDLTIITQT